MDKFGKAYFDSAYRGDYGKRNPQRKLRYYLNEIHSIKPSGDLLDIGCAYGLFLSIAQEYYTVTGCDISAYAVTEVKKRLPSIDVLQAGIETLNVDRAFDIVTCYDILEHVIDLDEAIEKIKRLLKAGGIAAVTVPVYDTIVGKIVGMLDKDETHIWKRERDFWREKLNAHGFNILKDIGLWRYCFMGHYIFFGHRILRNFSPALLLIGQKG